MGLKTFGLMAVDWEERVDFERLRQDRLNRIKAALKKSELGSLLCFDMNNIRYITATHIGTWAMDKLVRFSLLPQDDDPVLWDFGSAARHHQIYCPWLGERSRAGISTLRGATHPGSGMAADVAKKIKLELEQRKLANEPVGVDVIELPVLFALQAQGIKVVDGQQLMHEVRKIKTQDEITLLNCATMMVDAAYDELYRFMKPGVKENECVGVVSKVLYDLGSEHVEGVNAISGERCSPHPHVYTDRVLRPGDPAFFDILHSYNGYRTCYYRTFAVGSASPAMIDAYKRCRDYMDAAISIVKPGITTADVVKLWPRAQEFGFANEEAAFALQYGHGVGLSIWEKADLQPPGLTRSSRSHRRRHGVCAGNLLAGVGWLVRRTLRGRSGCNEGWLRSHYTLSVRKALGRRHALFHDRRRVIDDARDAIESQQSGSAGTS